VGVVFAFSLGLGFVVGLEIPFLNRWLQREKKIAELLAVDFAGGFLGGILFPLFLAPQLGLFRVAGVVAFLNAGVAAFGWYRSKDTVTSLAVPLFAAVSVILAGCFLYEATLIQSWLQNRFFGF
jgi:predicted membrane-bound spermidine synthase